MAPIFSFLKKYIQINSVTTKGNVRIAKAVGRDLGRLGCRVGYQVVRRAGGAFVNVLGLKGAGRGAPLMLCAHLDTVPPGELKAWTRTGGDPWRATTRGRRVCGLGAADDKASLVAMLRALAGFHAQDLKRPVLFLGTFGEESGMGGARAFVKKWKGPKPCLAIVGEPTNHNITYCHKGIGVIQVNLTLKHSPSTFHLRPSTYRFKGKQGHSSRPWTGDNALEKAIVFLKKKKHIEDIGIVSLEGGHAANIIPGESRVTYCEGDEADGFFPAQAVVAVYDAVQDVLRNLSRKKDKSFYPPNVTSNFGIAKTLKAQMELTFDFRLLPGISAERVYRDFVGNLKKRRKDFRGVQWHVEIERYNPPLRSDRDNAAACYGQALLKRCGLKGRLEAKPSCTEAGIYAAWGAPAFVFGPGRAQGNIHAPNECVELGQIEKSVLFYKKAIQELCVEGKCF